MISSVISPVISTVIGSVINSVISPVISRLELESKAARERMATTLKIEDAALLFSYMGFESMKQTTSLYSTKIWLLEADVYSSRIFSFSSEVRTAKSERSKDFSSAERSFLLRCKVLWRSIQPFAFEYVLSTMS